MTTLLTLASYLPNKNSETLLTEIEEESLSPWLKKSFSRLNRNLKTKSHDRQPIVDLSIKSFVNANKNLPRRKRKRNNVPQKISDINSSETRTNLKESFFNNFVSNPDLYDTSTAKVENKETDFYGR